MFENINASITNMIYHEPLSVQSTHRLEEHIRYLKLFEGLTIPSDQIIHDINSELMIRKIKADNGPSFSYGNQVVVTGNVPYFPKAASLEPPIGIVGRIIGKKKIDKSYSIVAQYELYEVEFLSSDVGYIWNEGDEEDRKYVRVYLNNWVMEKCGSVS